MYKKRVSQTEMMLRKIGSFISAFFYYIIVDDTVDVVIVVVSIAVFN